MNSIHIPSQLSPFYLLAGRKENTSDAGWTDAIGSNQRSAVSDRYDPAIKYLRVATGLRVGFEPAEWLRWTAGDSGHRHWNIRRLTSTLCAGLFGMAVDHVLRFWGRPFGDSVCARNWITDSNSVDFWFHRFKRILLPRFAISKLLVSESHPNSLNWLCLSIDFQEQIVPKT